MNTSTLLRKLRPLIVICALGLTASSAFSQEKGKAKGKDRTETKGKHGRVANELPYGLESRTEKKGELPSGLQKKKDNEGQLTRGLEDGGRNSKAPSKVTKITK